MPVTQPDPPSPSPPPASSQGWSPAAPDYVGVGTALSGASWWHGLVVAHPRVSRPAGTPDAVGFFESRWAGELDAGDIARYHALFARPARHLSGEWTPDYMFQAWAPAMLRRAAPAARLLVLLRDPVERFAAEHTPAGRSLSPGATPRAAANAAFSRGLYAEQLSRLWAVFPQEQVLVLQYERCLAEPEAELRRTYEFIGLEPEIPASLDPASRAGEPREARTGLSAWQVDQLVRRYAPENERLAALLPDLDLTLWQAPG